MRSVIALITLLALSACTTMLVGGASGGGSQSGGDKRGASVVAADSGITTQIKGKLSADQSVSVFDVGVKTRKGIVTLTGAVGSFSARERAAKIAKETDGVVAVNNLIVVEDRSDPK
ncbi:MAG: BON domain-containing protein [Gammaproteobacteria bacterium]|nr:BON domain-containing protein [Gammaproteobacteria bacterium]